tara:strand:- start:295 stop:453 length:159 start_codon:yes stop_codon:yes gene_type:complete
MSQTNLTQAGCERNLAHEGSVLMIEPFREDRKIDPSRGAMTGDNTPPTIWIE